MSEVTQVLAQIESGDPTAPDKLLPLVYEELRKLAAIHMARQDPGQTLQATALVHEAYVRLLGSSNLVDAAGSRVWRSRSQFVAAAAKAMRHILVDNARRKQAEKHGGDRRRRQLVDVSSPETMSPSDLLDLDDALERLARAYPRHEKLVELKFFAGVTQEEAADCLGISAATARRHWNFARAWLFGQLADSTAEEFKTV